MNDESHLMNNMIKKVILIGLVPAQGEKTSYRFENVKVYCDD